MALTLMGSVGINDRRMWISSHIDWVIYQICKG